MLLPENNTIDRTFLPSFIIGPEPGPRYRRIRFRLVCMVLHVLLLAMAASAQNAITIGGSSDLDFGSLPRSGAAEVGYESVGAARFIVTGDSGRDVRLTISVSALVARNGASTTASSRRFDPAVSAADCAYSLDDGNTWHLFSSGALYQDTRFPDAAGGASAIHVRVGGRLASSAMQQRGGYSGLVTLTAEYR